MGKIISNGIEYGGALVDDAMIKGVDYVTAGQLEGSTLGAKATAEGNEVISAGDYSHAEGSFTSAMGDYSHVEGRYTFAGNYAHSEGQFSSGAGSYSHAEGQYTFAGGSSAHAEGDRTSALGSYSHAEGNGTSAASVADHAEGQETSAYNYSHAEGNNTYAYGNSHAEGLTTTAGSYSHAEGSSTCAVGDSSHAEGNYTVARNPYAHAEGQGTSAFGESSHAEGYHTYTNGTQGNHAEGVNSSATGFISHAEGRGTLASGNQSHAEGNGTTAHTNSHAEGSYTYANSYSHAEGGNTNAIGDYSHAEGYNTTSYDKCSHSEGAYTCAVGEYQHVEGKYNVADSTMAHIIGNGTSTTRSNAFTVSWDGDVTAGRSNGLTNDNKLPTGADVNNYIHDVFSDHTVTGNPITFDAFTGLEITNECKVTMNPIQDLHGQSAPYPAGGGKNKSSVNSVSGVAWAVANADLKNVFNSLQNGTYTISFSIKVKTVTSTGEWIYGFMAQNPNGNISKMNTVTTDATVGDEGSIVQTFAITDSNRGAFTNVNLYGCGAWAGGAKGTSDFSNIQIELGNQATPFAPYENICPISGRTEASVTRTAGEDVKTKKHEYSETIYGGVDDFVNGGATITHKMVDMGSIEWGYVTSYTYPFFNAKLDIPTPSAGYDNGICSQYEVLPARTGSNFRTNDYDGKASFIYGQGNYNFAIQDSRYTSLSDFVTAMSGVQLCYELDTPTTIETSAENITLLKGNNVLSTNADDMELKYSADIKTYIDKAIQTNITDVLNASY